MECLRKKLNEYSNENSFVPSSSHFFQMDNKLNWKIIAETNVKHNIHAIYTRNSVKKYKKIFELTDVEIFNCKFKNYTIELLSFKEKLILYTVQLNGRKLKYCSGDTENC